MRAMGLAPVYGVDQAVAPRGLDNVDIDIVDGESPDSMSDEYSLDYPKITSDEQLIKGILGRTWPGIEYGEPPRPSYSFFQYVDAARMGDEQLFRTISSCDRDWWFPTLDRGVGSVLHFAVDHGQLAFV